ncbi:MAG TPA: CPBP family glutamic-type intramembrane protease [Thermodesulfobacteriota bacterium]|nr:CPBP family glutamic-type intramembrane protease [Thermodesulfobacteriota bacterium]
MFLDSIRKFNKALIVYVLSIASIFVFLLVFPNYVHTYTAAIFLLIPYLLGKGLNLRIEQRPFILGLIITISIIGLYLLLYYVFAKNTFNLNDFSLNIVLIHLIVIAFPEEAFFRGYLQQELGNNIKSIIIVSALFALAHFLTICIAKGSFGLHCATALLTFFPSLVMGYLYYKSKSIWECTIFHFLANMAFIATSGFSVFY